jgi:hypothetical protein
LSKSINQTSSGKVTLVLYSKKFDEIPIMNGVGAKSNFLKEEKVEN